MSVGLNLKVCPPFLSLIVTGDDSLLLLTKSFSAFPSPLYYLNSGPHLLPRITLHQPPREGVSRPHFLSLTLQLAEQPQTVKHII